MTAGSIESASSQFIIDLITKYQARISLPKTGFDPTLLKKHFDSILGHPITVLVTKVLIVTEAPLLLNILECKTKTGPVMACYVFV